MKQIVQFLVVVVMALALSAAIVLGITNAEQAEQKVSDKNVQTCFDAGGTPFYNNSSGFFLTCVMP